ncbi:MAG: MATE family efflux transporter [Candidatus Latescibacterota bacterium]
MALALTFLNNKLLYVFLDQEANGVYFLVIRLSSLVSLLLGDWLRLSNLNMAGGDRSLNRVLLANTIWFSILLGGSFFLVFQLVAPALPQRIFGLPHQYILIALAAGAAIILKDSLQSILLANQQLLRYAMTLIIFSILFAGMDFLFLVVFRFGLNSVIIAWFISATAAALWSFFVQTSLFGLSLRPSLKVFSKSRTIGWKALIAVIGMFLLINIHIYAIEPIIGEPGRALITVAMFSVCFRVFQLLQRFGDVSAYILHSRVVQQDAAASYQMTVRTIRSMILFSIAASLIAASFGRNLILIISNPEYSAAYVPLLIMIPGIIAVSAGALINSFYWGRGYPLKVTLAPFAAAAFSLVMEIILIPRIGLAGITLSVSVANLLWMGYLAIVFSRDSGMGLVEILVPRISDLGYLVSKLKSLPAGAAG